MTSGAAWLSAPTLLVWLLPLFAWAPLTHPGYFEFHSGFLPVFNLNDLLRHLTDLSWTATVGQPHDLLRGERMLPYLLAALARAAGASSVGAVKLVFGASLLAGSLGMYGWTRRRLGPWAALLAAMAYVYAPVVLATIYVRGGFAEAAFLGLMPWGLWAADAAAAGRRAAAVGLAWVLAAGLWTQVGLALWLAALLLVYCVARMFSRRSGWRETADQDRRVSGTSQVPGTLGAIRRADPVAFLGWAGGLALGGLGLLPVVLRHGWGGSAGSTLADHFVYLHQILLSGWGLGPSIPGPDDTLTFSVGVVAFGLAVLACFAGRDPADPASEGALTEHAAARFKATLAVILLFLSTTLAAPIWRLLPFLGRTLTYPWQTLLLAAPWLAWLAGLGGRRVLDGPGDRSGEGPGGDALLAVLLGLVLLNAYGNLAPLRTQAPVREAPVAILGDNQIALLDAVPAGTPGPGRTVTLAVRWQALRPLSQDYTVFFHALGPDGNRWGQQDVMPQGGKLPTSQWQPGQVVEDRYELVIAPDAPVGDYLYQFGMYQWQTGERLRAGTDDKVTVTP